MRTRAKGNTGRITVRLSEKEKEVLESIGVSVCGNATLAVRYLIFDFARRVLGEELDEPGERRPGPKMA